MSSDCSTPKIVTIGESGVGKSSLIVRFVDGAFNSGQRETIGMDIRVSSTAIDGNRVKLEIWDTAGQERFHAISSSYYRGAQGVICVYDVTNRSSFEKLAHWMRDVNSYCTNDNIIKMMIANKIDLPNRVVTREEGWKFANS